MKDLPRSSNDLDCITFILAANIIISRKNSSNAAITVTNSPLSNGLKSGGSSLIKDLAANIAWDLRRQSIILAREDLNLIDSRKKMHFALLLLDGP